MAKNTNTKMAKKGKLLTTNAGAPVADNQNVMTAGPRGPQLLQDQIIILTVSYETKTRASLTRQD